MTDSKPIAAEDAGGLLSLPLSAMQAGAELFERRARALGDAFISMAEAREPADLMHAGAEYWSHLLEDYARAMTPSVGAVPWRGTQPPAAPPGGS